jgi:hypothetical protein
MRPEVEAFWDAEKKRKADNQAALWAKVDKYEAALFELAAMCDEHEKLVKISERNRLRRRRPRHHCLRVLLLFGSTPYQTHMILRSRRFRKREAFMIARRLQNLLANLLAEPPGMTRNHREPAARDFMEAHEI